MVCDCRDAAAVLYIDLMVNPVSEHLVEQKQAFMRDRADLTPWKGGPCQSHVLQDLRAEDLGRGSMI